MDFTHRTLKHQNPRFPSSWEQQETTVVPEKYESESIVSVEIVSCYLYVFKNDNKFMSEMRKMDMQYKPNNNQQFR